VVDSLLEAGSMLISHAFLEEGGLTPKDGVNLLRPQVLQTVMVEVLL
jgi:hypothetical protein